MNKMIKRETNSAVTVDLEGLCGILSCGKTTARKIGEEAESRIVIGRRVLYSVDKVKAYVGVMAE